MRQLLLLFYLPLLLLNAGAQAIAQDSAAVIVRPVDSLNNIEQLIFQGESVGQTDSLNGLLLLRAAQAKARQQNNFLLLGRCAYAIGDIYFRYNLYNRAFANFSRAADNYTEAGAQKELVFASLGIAKCQYYRGNYRGAALNFVEAIRRGDSYKLKEVSAEANEYLGLIYSAFQNLPGNTVFYKKSLQGRMQLQDDKGITRVAGNLSDIYYRLRKFDSSLLYAEQSLLAAKLVNTPADAYMATMKKIACLIRLKKITAAENALQFFDTAANKPQDANLMVRYQSLLGNYYLAKKQYAASKMHYDSALGVINHNSFPELLLIVYENMASSWYEDGDIEKAYESYKKYNQQLAYFYTGDNIIKLANLEGLVTLEASKDEIRYLNSKNKLKALEVLHEQDLRQQLLLQNGFKDELITKEKKLSDALSRENDYKQQKLNAEIALRGFTNKELALEKEKLADERKRRLFLMAGLLLLLSFGAIIYIYYRKQRKKSLIIERQSEELRTLMKEIHHRVKNNLQVISSLLDLQSLSIQDAQASGAVKAGKLRVQSMALIHQNLYNDGNIRGIYMKDYIKNLSENLFQAYNILSNNICLVTDIDNLNLDVDTVIPLGLIINELVSNALKHAFKTDQQGQLFIGLKENKKQLFLEVRDTGPGFPPNSNNMQTTSFGFRLINAFAKKLKARMDMYNNNGATVTMVISKYKIAAI